MYEVLVYLTLFLGVLPLGMFIFRVKSKNKAFVPLLILFFLASLYEFIASFLLKIKVGYWFQIYSLFEFIVVYYLFSHLLNQRPKGYIYTFLGLFTLVYLYSFSICFKEDFSFLKAKSLTKIFITLFVIVSSYLWVKQIFEQKTILKLYNEASFYFVLGLFMYYSVDSGESDHVIPVESDHLKSSPKHVLYFS